MGLSCLGGALHRCLFLKEQCFAPTAQDGAGHGAGRCRLVCNALIFATWLPRESVTNKNWHGELKGALALSHIWQSKEIPRRTIQLLLSYRLHWLTRHGAKRTIHTYSWYITMSDIWAIAISLQFRKELKDLCQRGDLHAESFARNLGSTLWQARHL